MERSDKQATLEIDGGQNSKKKTRRRRTRQSNRQQTNRATLTERESERTQREERENKPISSSSTPTSTTFHFAIALLRMRGRHVDAKIASAGCSKRRRDASVYQETRNKSRTQERRMQLSVRCPMRLTGINACVLWLNVCSLTSLHILK